MVCHKMLAVSVYKGRSACVTFLCGIRAPCCEVAVRLHVDRRRNFSFERNLFDHRVYVRNRNC